MGVMVSAHDFEAMRAYYANRLIQTMDQAGRHANLAGLTPRKLSALLKDER